MNTSNETPETETTDEAPKQSEPIDAEFEPAQGPDPSPEKPAKTGVGMATVAAWSIGAALAGGTIGVIGAGASNVDTSKFASSEVTIEVDKLASQQSDVSDKLDKAWETISITEARLEGQVEALNDKLAARTESEALLRDEFDALVAQLDALVGPAAAEETPAAEAASTEESDGETAEPTETTPAKPALQRLMDRIGYLETRLAETDESPETTGQLKRALTDVSDRLDALEAANTELERVMQQREKALASLQSGLFNANQAIADVEDRVVTLAEQEKVAPEPATATEVDSEIEALRADIEALKAATVAAPPEADTPGATFKPTPDDASSSAPATAPVQPALDSAAEPDVSEKEQMALAISAASLAMAKLDGDSANGKPFPSSWDRLKDAMPDNANVDAIKAISRRGAPTLGELRTGFSTVKSELETKIKEQGKNDGWDWWRKAFGGVVSVRRTDIEGDTPEAALNRISKALDEADLPAAVENAELLEGFSDSDFDTWLAGARARLTLDANVEAVREEILAQSAELAKRN